jgi:type II secretory pathway component PulK
VRAHRRPTPRRRTGGFILIVVLVALVVITLLATAVATSTDRALAQAQEDSRLVSAEISQFSTRETLLFLLATQRQTVAGITVDDQVANSYGNALWAAGPDDVSTLPPPLPVGNEIALNASIYLAPDGQRFSLQDDSGLFSVNWTPEPIRSGVLASLGVDRARQGSLEAVRLDYQDPDVAYRIGGAEAEAYEEADLPPPTNSTILSPLELRRMPGWRELVAGLDDRQLLSRFTTARTFALNVNTAPVEILRGLPGADASVTERIVAQRQALPFLLRWEFLQTYPLALDDESPVSFLASGTGNLLLWDTSGGPVRLIHWSLTPVDEDGRPWRIDYEIKLPRDTETGPSPARTPATALLAEPGQAGG